MQYYMATIFTQKKPQIEYSCGFAGFLSLEVQANSKSAIPLAMSNLE